MGPYRIPGVIISALFLLIFACQERPRSNPYDPDTDLNPAEWAPGNLQAEVLNDSQIRLSWVDNCGFEEGFRIERQIEGSDWSLLGEVVTDMTTYTDSDILSSDDELFSYRLYAFTSNNHSDYSNTAGAGFVTDIYGNRYKTVLIGNQWWLAENLKVTHYRNGDEIPNVTSGSEWSSLSYGAWCAYNNDDGYISTYGRLYNWYAVNDSRKIAPEGWHVPSDDEWKQLEMYLGMSQPEADYVDWRGAGVGGKLKETGTVHWNSPNTGATNESGFTALPGGCRFNYGSFVSLGDSAGFWSAPEYDASNAWSRGLYGGNSDVARNYYDKQGGVSVRCVRG